MPKGIFNNPVERAAKIAKAHMRGDYFNCLICGDRFWRKPYEIKKGNNRFCCRGCYHKYMTGRKRSMLFRNKCKQRVGERNPNWRGGLKTINKKIRDSKEYREWKLCVFRRDKRTCRKCGSKYKIHAHHIKSFAKFPELRFCVDNGLTLCKDCHDLEPKGHQILNECA